MSDEFFDTSHVYIVNWATFRQLLLQPKKAPGWLFVHLIKWVHGQEAFQDKWGDYVFVPTRTQENVRDWKVILPDGTNLHQWGHPQYQEFVQDQMFLRDCRIEIEYVDGTFAYYNMVDAEITEAAS